MVLAVECLAVQVGEARLAGNLALPSAARGIVAFTQGSASSRPSPHDNYVAGVLHRHGLATLLLDLLDEAESGDLRKRSDIGLLAARAIAALDWLARHETTAKLRAGLFGASTGAAAALRAAAERPGRVEAIVSRGGRPDLAGTCLPEVNAPTLLIVGGQDAGALRLNRRAMRSLRCSKRLEVVPGATRLFEEPGALDAAAHLAGAWFETHLARPGTA